MAGNTPDDGGLRRRHRRPLVAISTSFALGIAIDHFTDSSLLVWICSLSAALLGAVAFRRSARAATGLLILGTLCAGGAWHDIQFDYRTVGDVGWFASEERRLCRIQGAIVGEVATIQPSDVDSPLMSVQEPRSRFTLTIERIEDGDGWHPATGSASVTVNGVATGIRAGDGVDVVGWSSRPRGPLNPGEFNYPEYLNAQGIRATVFTETPKAVRILPDRTRWSLSAARDQSREALSGLLQRHLDPSDASVGEAFLLGVRSALSPDELSPFIESGTVHIIVVSGMHVGLLAAIVWGTLTAFGLSLSQRALWTIVSIAGYTFLTGANAPAVRAAVLTGLIFGGYLLNRGVDAINSLAGSALVVLLLNPSDLFQPGPQLSFVCALALLVIVPPLLLSPPDEREDSIVRRLLTWVGRWLANLAFVSAVLWIVTAPLVMHSFHLWSPISIVASLPLVVTSGATLFFGVVFFALGWIPYVGALVAWPLGWLLRWMTVMSDWAATVEPLCVYVVGPPWWWVLGFYAILMLPWLWAAIAPASRMHLWTMAVWVAVGLVHACLPNPPRSPEYTQLAVGHGLAGVLRTPTGETVLFDCGSIGGPKVAERVIAPFLWHEGVSRIDAVVVSHADIDHFNGLVKLARRFRIGKVIVAPAFAHSKEPAVGIVLDELRRREIPVQFIWQGDSIELDDVSLEVLHPAIGFQGKTDNAGSLVLRLSHGGRSILLTGDLADDGLVAMLGSRIGPVDVFVAPHHGSRTSNNDRTARWAAAGMVISSQGDEDRSIDPLDAYSRVGARVFRTNETGAVTVRWGMNGMEVKEFRKRKGEDER